MKSHELLPGGALILRSLVDEQTAVETGQIVKAKIDSSSLPPILMTYDVAFDGRPMNGFSDQDHEEITDKIAELTGEDFDRGLLDVIAVYMRHPFSRFGFHADNAQDIRTIVNVSDKATEFSTIRTEPRSLTFDTEGWVRGDTEKLELASHSLNPGDAYIINNLGSSYAHKVAHATPTNSQGRLTLRYDQHFQGDRENTSCNIVVPECVKLEVVAEGFNLEPLPSHGG